jgi:hypothetical protein
LHKKTLKFNHVDNAFVTLQLGEKRCNRQNN